MYCAHSPPNQIKDQLADKQIIYRQLIRLLSGRDLIAGEEGRPNAGLSSTTTCYQSSLVCGCFLTCRLRKSILVPMPNALRFRDQRNPLCRTSSFHAVSVGSAGIEKGL